MFIFSLISWFLLHRPADPVVTVYCSSQDGARLTRMKDLYFMPAKEQATRVILLWKGRVAVQQLKAHSITTFT